MCAQLTRERASLLLEVAHLYWDEDLDQATIASKMGYSRPTVSRMLSEARRHGVVTVTVSHPIERLMALEEQLAQAFGLKEARVAEGNHVRTALCDRTLCLDPSRLSEIPLVIGVAAGRDKVEALRATLRGGYLSALVTDESTARSLLEGV